MGGGRDQYQLLECIGKGSYGKVFRVRRKDNGRLYALKQISLVNVTQGEVRDIINEVHVLNALDHENVIQYIESYVCDDTLDIVMELASGGNLHDWLKARHGRPLAEPDIWRFFIQVALGLQHIHSEKVLHRDLKTMNIFLDEMRNIKIGDLGVAKMMSSTNSLAQSKVGTPFFLSPELCEDRPYNEKSDVWALGCVLYELCTLTHPFDANNQGALILKIIRGHYPPISNRYSRELAAVIRKCLTHDAEFRPSVLKILASPPVQQWARKLGVKLPFAEPVAVVPVKSKTPPPTAAVNTQQGSDAVTDPAPPRTARGRWSDREPVAVVARQQPSRVTVSSSGRKKKPAKVDVKPLAHPVARANSEVTPRRVRVKPSTGNVGGKGKGQGARSSTSAAPAVRRPKTAGAAVSRPSVRRGATRQPGIGDARAGNQVGKSAPQSRPLMRATQQDLDDVLNLPDDSSDSEDHPSLPARNRMAQTMHASSSHDRDEEVTTHDEQQQQVRRRWDMPEEARVAVMAATADNNATETDGDDPSMNRPRTPPRHPVTPTRAAYPREVPATSAGPVQREGQGYVVSRPKTSAGPPTHAAGTLLAQPAASHADSDQAQSSWYATPLTREESEVPPLNWGGDTPPNRGATTTLSKERLHDTGEEFPVVVAQPTPVAISADRKQGRGNPLADTLSPCSDGTASVASTVTDGDRSPRFGSTQVTWRVMAGDDERQEGETGDVTDSETDGNDSDGTVGSGDTAGSPVSGGEDPFLVTRVPDAAHLLDRVEGLKRRTTTLHNECLSILGKDKFDQLYNYLNSDDESADKTDIFTWISRNLPQDKVVAVQKMYQLLYLESEFKQCEEELEDLLMTHSHPT